MPVIERTPAGGPGAAASVTDITRPESQYTQTYALAENHLKNSGNHESQRPKIIPRPAHNVSRKEISSRAALKVLYRLHKAGYQAFLVGGGVRDAMLGLHPKDFDIATDATPGRGACLVQQLPPDRAAVSAGARPLRSRDHRGRHVPRRGQSRG